MSDQEPTTTPVAPVSQEPDAPSGVALSAEEWAQVQTLIAGHNQLVHQNALLTQQMNELRGNKGIPSTKGEFRTHVVSQDEEHNIELVGQRENLDPALVYAHNSVTLEGNALARGFRDAEGGRLIWAGTSLKIPVAA